MSSLCFLFCKTDILILKTFSNAMPSFSFSKSWQCLENSFYLTAEVLNFMGDVSLRTMPSLGCKWILLCCWAGYSITPWSGSAGAVLTHSVCLTPASEGSGPEQTGWRESSESFRGKKTLSHLFWKAAGIIQGIIMEYLQSILSGWQLEAGTCRAHSHHCCQAQSLALDEFHRNISSESVAGGGNIRHHPVTVW